MVEPANAHSSVQQKRTGLQGERWREREGEGRKEHAQSK
jgi:hypothetical protein